MTTFNSALNGYISNLSRIDALVASHNTALAGHGADWGMEPAVAERAAIWSAVSATEADYDARFTKVDGREG